MGTGRPAGDAALNKVVGLSRGGRGQFFVGGCISSDEYKLAGR